MVSCRGKLRNIGGSGAPWATATGTRFVSGRRVEGVVARDCVIPGSESGLGARVGAGEEECHGGQR